jgi:hypothetical protein
MWPFSKKLTSTQKAEVQEFASTLRTVRQQCEQALLDMESKTVDLSRICGQALEEDRDLGKTEYLLDAVGHSILRPHYVHRVPEETADTGALIEKAKEAIQVFRDSQTDMQTRILSHKPASWYPKKYRKAHDSLAFYFESSLRHVTIATGALQPPQPLKHDPRHGNDKLNLFTYALSSNARHLYFLQRWFLPKDL